MKFQSTDAGRGAVKERNDCTVCAIASATDTPYQDVHTMLKDAGRKDGHRFKFISWSESNPYVFGYRMKNIPLPVSVPNTLNQVTKLLPSTGRYIIRVRGRNGGHVFAYVNGVMLDKYPEPPKRRVLQIWKLEKNSEIFS